MQFHNNDVSVYWIPILTHAGKEIIVEAIDLLTHNAKNLIHAVEEVLRVAERAIIKLPASEKERLNLIHQTTPDSLSTPHLGNAYLCLAI